MEYTHSIAGKVGPDMQFVPTFNGKFIPIPISRNDGWGGGSAKGYEDIIFGGFNWSHQFTDDWSITHSVSVNQNTTDRLMLFPYSPVLSPTGDQKGEVEEVVAGQLKQGMPLVIPI